MTKKILIPLSLVIITFCGCYNDTITELYPNIVICDTSTVTWATHVQPIMQQNCAVSSCHDAQTQQSNYDFAKYVDVKRAADDKSRDELGMLLGTVTHAAGYSQMPSGKPKMDECTLMKLKKWVREGALEN